jgi:hypothetical protein
VGDRRGRVLAVAVLLAVLTGCEAGVAGEPQVSTPSATPSPTVLDPTIGGEVVHRWPDTTRNPPGLYSWNGSSYSGCGSHTCHVGVMHNGWPPPGPVDMWIHVQLAPGGGITEGATAATVAGRDGVYLRIDPRRELWLVDIEGTTISIRLTARPGTSHADLAEAHAIIGSMRAQLRDNDLGFRLVFTLATDDWTSG